jgi:hypothetical protein
MGLAPELLQAIKEAIANGDIDINAVANSRSPFRPRQLHNLTLLPTKDDPRPTFFWSVEGPRNDAEAGKTHPYPRLLWHADGTEIRVENATEHREKVAAGYLEVAPGTVELDQAAQIRAMLEALSPADRALVIDGNKKARIQAAVDAMAAASDADVEAVLASLEQTKAKKSA